jgi:acetyltransferase-like isoleucine patch superfamily enzyme
MWAHFQRRVERKHTIARGRFHLRRGGVTVGARPRVTGRAPQLDVRGTARAGEDFGIRGVQFPVQITVWAGACLEIGDDVSFNQGVNIQAARNITIGDHTRFGDLAAVRTSDTHEVHPHAPVSAAPVVIGRNVWVGRNAIIMQGVTIGDHAVIAAGAIVTSDVPRCSVVAGVPAKVRSTFDAPDGWVRA